MSYTPTNWQTDDTITAEKLNNMEGGISNAPGYDLLVTATVTQDSQFILSLSVDKTATEVETALAANKMVGVLFKVTPYSAEPWTAYGSYSNPYVGAHEWCVTVSGNNGVVTASDLQSVILVLNNNSWLLGDKMLLDANMMLSFDPDTPPVGMLLGVAPGDGLFGWQVPNYHLDIGPMFEQLIHAALLQAENGKATLTATLSSEAADAFSICLQAKKYLSAGWGITLGYQVGTITANAIGSSFTYDGSAANKSVASATFSGRFAMSFTSSTAASYDLTLELMACRDDDDGSTYTAIASVTAEKIAHTFIS